MIFRRFLTTFRRFSKILQNLSRVAQTLPNIFQKFPNIADGCGRLSRKTRRYFDHTPMNLSTINVTVPSCTCNNRDYNNKTTIGNVWCNGWNTTNNSNNNNNNNNNNIYPGSPLVLAVFSGALQIIIKKKKTLYIKLKAKKRNKN